MDFLNTYQTIPSHINPELTQIGFFAIRWYSIGYLLAFATILGLIFWRISKKEFDSRELPPKKLKEVVLDVFFSGVFGMIVGARLGYFIFYDWTTLIFNFSEVFITGSNGFFGFSFHGGLIGALLGIYIYCKLKKISFEGIGNLFIPALPLGFFWGRLGNFFNGELFGHPTDKPWGMFFPTDPKTLRHPSQLYEALGEGVIIFIVLWTIRKRDWAQGNFLSLFLILYGLIRFIIEFFRVSPPEHILLGFLTTGQVLCLAMIVGGVYIFKK